MGSAIPPERFIPSDRLTLFAIAVVTTFLAIAVRLIFIQIIDRDELLSHQPSISEPAPLIRNLVGYIEVGKVTVLAIAALAVGKFLYWLRTDFRFVYGILEVSTGLVTVITFRDEISFDTLFLLKALGGLYIVVRGLDNIAIAKEADRISPRDSESPKSA